MNPDLGALIRRVDDADPAAADQLFTLLYDELHRLAERNLRRSEAAATLGPTTLLHEVYLNIAGREGVAFPDRGRFLAYASRAMRGLVIDYARRRRARRRGRDFEITLVEDVQPAAEGSRQATDLARLGDALAELAESDYERYSRTLVSSISAVMGFSMNAVPGSRTPWCTIASSV